MKFHILTFGCQMNYADSARIKAVLLNCGFSYSETINDADIIIFDTCSVRQKAEDKITGKLKEIPKDKKIWISGCMIQHNLRNSKLGILNHRNSAGHSDKGKKISENLKVGNFLETTKSKEPAIIGFTTEEINNVPLIKGDKGGSEISNKGGVVVINHAFNPLFFNLQKTYSNLELMFRIDDTGFLPLIMKQLGYEITYDQEIINEYEKIIPENILTSMNPHKTTAYIPISTGCNQFCSYCIVPYARGLEKHFSVQQIVDEAKQHLKSGAKELVLLGQIVNKHPEFITIIKEILKLDGLKRLRYTSPYPTYYSQELLELHEKEKKLCPHIHIPLQSGSNKILKAMFRGYTAEESKQFIDNIRNLKKDISLTTDIIVGFPGETEEDFQQTLDLVKYGKFDMIYIGIYSPRPGTHAAKNLKDDISADIKHDRRARLNDLLNKISQENNKQEIGKTREVLINKIVTCGVGQDTSDIWQVTSHKPQLKYEGYTDNMKQIIVDGDGEIGEFVKVKITDGKVFKLYGEVS